MNENFIKIFLITYFLLYYGILFVLNSILVYKTTGKNPVVLGKSKGVIGFVENSIRKIGIITPVVLVIYVFLQDQYYILLPINYLEGKQFDLIGLFLMGFAFTWCLIAQINMHSSWRIGIDKTSETILVTKGLFAVSRNPFFLGTLLTFMGFFLILPNILTFALMNTYYFLIQIQVRLEEEFLKKSLGDSYLIYQNNVRRWI